MGQKLFPDDSSEGPDGLLSFIWTQSPLSWPDVLKAVMGRPATSRTEAALTSTWEDFLCVYAKAGEATMGTAEDPS